ncbi:3-phosphoshikimate 1-carboxyvinyltransferase [Deinococcus metallilatus]|uniref:3-phosphoshikimate 1-carboxyvinyltransferase n=1 Tax=Deinococcus metallilatus TaxID=1211322 RepID=A0AAJ5F2P9_9DEIO|nr:3-phosphoshikimate 1-carboxyvinyltransferase [Deinococcus metallilatus]MBB5295115.1 3-phosphoshikimate 1-carboxyvinyltransferase [Deinococcus metallilatus]QBY08706.1 3-phosphoshikimate 1-carboxyvinyltransferase [Deinococcus metallilatus]RXJ10585.1 3-phosphoshikimate 1-carboxyvinyltransferase [Deinococcus metallilatus]TLK26556.1 3-phosphoshikimate 1-carboxyvinyltransferase [Deinococcus metallilatus]GMA14888.1 3-phosphoshikimate 1-carboxyvinyltransferase [Deinococcus metallilatus]
MTDGLPERFDVLVHPASELRGERRAQPSKNYTTRYLLAAALAEGETRVVGAATSEDAEALVRCLRDWGAGVERVGEDVVVRGFGAHPRAGVTLNPGNAGAVARFLMGVAALTTETTFVTDYAESLGRRPQGDLLAALERLGARVSSNGGRLPITIGGPVRGGRVEVSAERSSQYASALMFLAPLLQEGLDLRLTGEIKSHAPLRQTLDTLAAFGIRATASADLTRITIPGGQAYRAGRVLVPGDYPGSAALLAAAALLPGEVTVTNLRADDLQGEREAVDVLRAMGADLVREGDRVTVRGGKPLHAVTRDGDGFTDAVQALTAAAAFAHGTTTWENVATLRLKECDRISDTRRELERLGLKASETEGSLSVTGTERLAGGVTVGGHGDHRMIMLLTLLGLRADAPIRITGAHHIRKSYPSFFRHLEGLGARFEYLATDAP